MKLQTIFFSFAASVALCQNTSDSLLAVLQSDPDTQAFGQLLGEFPDLLANLDPSKKFTVFAPSNDAVLAFRQTFNLNGSLVPRSHGLSRRSLSEYAAAIALLFTDQAYQTNLNTEPTDLITNLTDPAFINIEPASVSASPTPSSISTLSSSSPVESIASSGQPTTNSVESTASSAEATTSSLLSASSSGTPPPTSAPPPSSSASPPESTLLPTSNPPPATSSPAAPPPNPKGAHLPFQRKKPDGKRSITSYSPYFRRQLGSGLFISSGFGKQSVASLNEVQYESGAVRKIDSFFTLFGDLASTLQETNGTAFAGALARAGTLDSLSKTPRITVFVPNDAALQGQTLDADALKRYVIPNTLATSTSLTTGSYNTSAGDTVNVTSNTDGSFSINNATIVKSDVMIKNGVVHYIDNVYTSTLTASAPGLNIPTLAIAVAIFISTSTF